MERAHQIKAVIATAAAMAALAVPVAGARAEAESSAAPTPGATLEAPPVPVEPEVVEQEDALEAPPVPEKEEPPASGSGGVEADGGDQDESVLPTPPAGSETESGVGATVAPGPSTFAIPSLPQSSCAVSGVPPVLIPIYHRASDKYALGPQGPAILAAINAIETAFGSNLGPSYAGAEGWMQFMPETWAYYGVDANGDGVKDPNNPEDAIFAAARYLSASGMPADIYGAIFAYNHADWYVEDVLEHAACYADEVGGSYSTLALNPQIQVLSCEPAEAWRKEIPEEYMRAFEAAAGRYELGRDGVWTLAAIARLESDFGRGMSKAQLRNEGALGLDSFEWRDFAVDGNGDGRVRHQDIDDSAATLARLIWSRGGIEAGVFTHNQASWYVDAVTREAERLEGKCGAKWIDWSIALPGSAAAQINWSNLVLSSDLELADIQNGLLDQRIMALLAVMTQEHEITISSLRSDHSMMTASGNVSNHYYGRAMDIAAVDGVACTNVAPSAPCAQLGYALSQMPAPLHPDELIFCFDLDGAGPAFALADHCDHIHAGFSEY